MMGRDKMAIEFNDPDERARSEEYTLKCKVIVKEITYEDVQSKGEVGLITEEMIFLEPKEGTQRDLFFSAWLPDYEQDPITKKIVAGHTEVTCKAGHPINGYFKCSVHRQDERSSVPYLFVMTKSAEEELKQMNGRDLIFSVLGQNDEDLGDYMKDHDLSGKRHVNVNIGGQDV